MSPLGGPLLASARSRLAIAGAAIFLLWIAVLWASLSEPTRKAASQTTAPAVPALRLVVASVRVDVTGPGTAQQVLSRVARERLMLYRGAVHGGQVEPGTHLDRTVAFGVCGSHQNSPVDEIDRALPSHRVQANSDALARGSHDGSNFPVRQRNIDQHAFRLADAVAIGKVRQQSIEPRRDGVQRKVCQPLFGMFKPVSDQSKGIFVKQWLRGHAQFELFRGNFQQHAGLVSHRAVFPLAGSRVERRLAEHRALRKDVNHRFAIGLRELGD